MKKIEVPSPDRSISIIIQRFTRDSSLQSSKPHGLTPSEHLTHAYIYIHSNEEEQKQNTTETGCHCPFIHQYFSKL